LSQAASSRTRVTGSPLPSLGRACAGLVQCGWWPSGPRAAASRARSSQSSRSSPAWGGRMRAATGNRRCRAEKRRQIAPSSGHSTWQETTATSRKGTLVSMCGICGIYSPDAEARAALVSPMLETLRHRGPDDSTWEAREWCVLGSRRLRVIDLEQGDQPVANETGDVVCVFNGELYNFPQLRRELDARGHAVKGHGDTAVIPHLYEEHGVEFVDRLEGMFAIALYSARERRLVLARDRLGKKPLVLTRLADGTVAFASELRAFTTLPGFSAEPDLAALDAYLALGYVPGDRTGLRGVRRLPPAHRLVVDEAGERLERYWTPEPAAGDGD